MRKPSVVFRKKAFAQVSRGRVATKDESITPGPVLFIWIGGEIAIQKRPTQTPDPYVTEICGDMSSTFVSIIQSVSDATC